MADQSTDIYRRIAHDLIRTEFRLQVISDSMWPLLRRGDAVIAEPIEPTALRRGDIAVIRRGAELITHRLIATDSGGWYLRGDAAIWVDEVVTAQAIVGRVRAIERATQPIDLRRPPWPEVNRRVGEIERVHWRIAHRLRLDRRAANRLQLGLTWLSALPVRVIVRIWIVIALKRTL